MKKCPKCKVTYGQGGGKPGAYKFCPMCGTELLLVRRRIGYLTREEWEEFNRIEHAIPWETEVRVKGAIDEPF